MALHATVTSLDTAGTQRHVHRALEAGATPPEIMEVVFTIGGVANHALYFAVPVLLRELAAAGGPQAELPEVTPEAQAIKDEFIRVRGVWNEQRDVIVRLMPEYFAVQSQQSTIPWTDGTLSQKERELICIAIDCTVTHMFGH